MSQQTFFDDKFLHMPTRSLLTS